MWNYFFSITGKHAPVTWRAFFNAMNKEFLCSVMIGAIVPLVIWMCSNPTVVPVSAFMVAISEAAIWYAAVRFGSREHSLRRHCNCVISMVYCAWGEIGIWGLLAYVAAQTLGSLIGGLIVGAILMGAPILGPLAIPAAGSPLAVRSTVPIPVTTLASFGTIVSLHIFAMVAIALTKLVVEFLNTDGVSDSTMEDYATAENQKRLHSNSKKADLATAFVIFGMVMLGYQFGAFSFSNVTYGGGLFSGLVAGDLDLKGFGKLKDLHSTDYPLSVWSDRNGAAAFYLLIGWAAGLIAALFFLVWGFIGFENGPGERYRKGVPAQQWDGPYAKAPAAAASASEAASE